MQSQKTDKIDTIMVIGVIHIMRNLLWLLSEDQINSEGTVKIKTTSFPQLIFLLTGCVVHSFHKFEQNVSINMYLQLLFEHIFANFQFPCILPTTV